jgi:hypothetical protein
MVRRLSILVLVASCSNAPFEGEITMRTTTTSGPPHDLVLKAKGERLRFDMKGATGEDTHGIFDPAANKITVFVDSQKSYTDVDFSSGAAATPNIDPRSASAKKTGKTETMAGLRCDDYVVGDETGKRTEVCLAPGLVYFDIGSLRPGGATPSVAAAEFRVKKLFPLKSVEIDVSGKETSRAEVTKIEKKSLDDALFAIPAGYKRVDLPKPPRK